MQVQYTVKYTVHQSGGGCDPGGSRAAALLRGVHVPPPTSPLLGGLTFGFRRSENYFILRRNSQRGGGGLGKAALNSTSSRCW